MRSLASCIVTTMLPRCRHSQLGRRSQLLSKRTHRKCLAASASASQAPSPLDLVAWVRSQGGKVHGVTVANLAGKDGGAGWGMLAESDAAAGTRLMDLPAQCHLTYSESDDPKLLKLIDKVPAELWGAKLALQLLSQRVQGAASPLALYIANLPVGFPGIPIFFDGSAIAAIDYPPVVEQVKKRCAWLASFSRDVLGKLPGSCDDPFGGVSVDINALGWAMAAVTSRAFRTRGKAHPASCLPLIDLANHSFEPNIEVRPTPTGIALSATRALSTGEPLLLCYGELSNDFLFMDYGFVIEDNPHDRVQLRFGVDLLQAGCMIANVEMDGSDLELRPTQWQRKILSELDLSEPGGDLEVSFGGVQHIDPRLLAAARVLVAKSQEEVTGRSLAKLGALAAPLNKRNERAALRALSGVAAYSLSRFATTLDADLAGLKAGVVPVPPLPPGEEPPPSSPLSESARLAVRFRVEKKKVLSRAIQALGRQLEALPSMDVPAVPGAPKKGQAPPAATSKGFGKRAGSK